MKVIGIIAAMDVELEAIKNIVQDEKKVVIAKHTFYEGSIGDEKIVFVDSGVGKVNAALITQAMIDHFKVDAVINTGIAGGLDPSLKHMSVVLGESLSYHDFDHDLMKRFYPYKDSFSGDERLLSLMEDVFSERDLRRGNIITGDQFISSKEKQLQLREDFQGTCVEMEGAAIAHVCDANDIPFLGVRSISDFADDDGEEDYEKFERRAAVLAGEIVVDLVGRI
ncbi:MAG: 5'-methylthioadenosine/adenosylhomocysteine nucleosidase [Gallicola sp.]|nr:5'-methylthioadenosine/adenosylhomocysteine nucleosidase [Gallicola sp.]